MDFQATCRFPENLFMQGKSTSNSLERLHPKTPKRLSHGWIVVSGDRFDPKTASISDGCAANSTSNVWRAMWK